MLPTHFTNEETIFFTLKNLSKYPAFDMHMHVPLLFWCREFCMGVKGAKNRSLLFSYPWSWLSLPQRLLYPPSGQHALCNNMQMPWLLTIAGKEVWCFYLKDILYSLIVTASLAFITDVIPLQATFSKSCSWILAAEIFCIIWWSYFISDFWTQQIVHLDSILPHFIDGLTQIFQVCAHWPWRSSLLFKFYDTET